MFLRRRPSTREVEQFIKRCRELPLSYEPVGLANQNPIGFAVDEQVAVVGAGAAAFERAKIMLAQWKHFALGWLEVFPIGASITPGTVVAIVVRHWGFWSMNGCRVVYQVGARVDREVFKVSFREDTGQVTYSIRAVSRPRAALARLGYPVARLIQTRFRRDSARALTRAIAG